MAADPIHEDLRAIARWLPRAPIGPLSARVIRGLGGLQARLASRNVEVVTLSHSTVRIYRPAGGGGNGPALLWIHGGGYVVGIAAQDDPICRHFADELGIVVASVDYRLAPAARFPAPLDDCHEALVWLARKGQVDASRIAIGGASAGGGLAAGLALMARERGEVDVAFQLLVYPMIDDRTVLRDVDETSFRLWTNRSNRFGWQAYTGLEPGGPAMPPFAAAARHDDLAGLPPAWIGVGTLDLFHDEDLAYAERLRAAGVPCDVEIVPGAFHGFDAVAAKTGLAKTFRASQVAALRAALALN